MTLNSYSIPNLIQGVSQQSDSQRDPAQGEVQELVGLLALYNLTPTYSLQPSAE